MPMGTPPSAIDSVTPLTQLRDNRGRHVIMSTYLNPFTDFGFKRIFGEEFNKDLIIDFLDEWLWEEAGVFTAKKENTGDTSPASSPPNTTATATGHRVHAHSPQVGAILPP